MNIFIRELKANLKSLIIWSVIVILFIWMGFSKFSAYYENPELLAIVDSMPKALLDAFEFNAFNLTTVNGFLGVMYPYFAIMLAISSAMWGSDIISKEENDKTIEFALTLPVKREKLVTAKTLAALVNCFVLLLVTWGITIASVSVYKPDDEFFGFLQLSMVGLFLMQLIFLAVGVFLGCAMKKHRSAGSVAVSVILFTYFLSILISINKDLKFLRYFTPFKYFDTVKMLTESKIDVLFVLLSVGIVAVCLTGAFVSYSKRDLYI